MRSFLSGSLQKAGHITDSPCTFLFGEKLMFYSIFLRKDFKILITFSVTFILMYKIKTYSRNDNNPRIQSSSKKIYNVSAYLSQN